MTRRSGLPFTATFRRRADIQGACRLVENNRLSFEAMLGPLAEELARRPSVQTQSLFLCVQDTTEIELTHLVAAEGLGPVGNPECRGEFLRSAIVLTPAGIPAGVSAATTWTRDPNERGKA